VESIWLVEKATIKKNEPSTLLHQETLIRSFPNDTLILQLDLLFFVASKLY
jgi:hypothetical protein